METDCGHEYDVFMLRQCLSEVYLIINYIKENVCLVVCLSVSLSDHYNRQTIRRIWPGVGFGLGPILIGRELAPAARFGPL